MRGIVVHCPNPDCKKLLMKEASLPPTTQFQVKCYWCSHLIKLDVDFKRIGIKDMTLNSKPGITLI